MLPSGRGVGVRRLGVAGLGCQKRVTTPKCEAKHGGEKMHEKFFSSFTWGDPLRD